jgi:muconolactone delta-isomerase
MTVLDDMQACVEKQESKDMNEQISLHRWWRISLSWAV